MKKKDNTKKKDKKKKQGLTGEKSKRKKRTEKEFLNWETRMPALEKKKTKQKQELKA